MSTCFSCQVEAFSDYKPGSGGGGGGGGQAEQKPQQESQPSPSDGGEQAESSSGGGGGGGGSGNWPSHSVLGLPALSPTMSQGALPTVLEQRTHPAKQSSLEIKCYGAATSVAVLTSSTCFYEPLSWTAVEITSAASSFEDVRAGASASAASISGPDA